MKATRISRLALILCFTMLCMSLPTFAEENTVGRLLSDQQIL